MDLSKDGKIAMITILICNVLTITKTLSPNPSIFGLCKDAMIKQENIMLRQLFCAAMLIATDMQVHVIKTIRWMPSF